MITNSPITDAITVITGGNGDFVVGTGFGTVVFTSVEITVTEAVVGAGVETETDETAINGTGAEPLLCEVDPVLKMLSSPNAFETVSRTSYDPSNG